jgi:hypothetical protein
LSKSKTKIESAKKILSEINFFSGQIASTRLRGLVIMHGLVTLFLGVIALAIILLVIGLGAFRVLVVMLRTIVESIILITIVRLAIIAIALVASMMSG